MQWFYFALVLWCFAKADESGNSGNCGDAFNEIPVADCLAANKFCVPPGDCNNDQCQKKCLTCNCAQPQHQCKRNGNNVYCDCSQGIPPLNYGPNCDLECLIDTHCGNNEVCVNNHCQCAFGYYDANEGDGELNCQNLDDCVGVMCPTGATCQDLIGAYTCICPSGSNYNGTHCVLGNVDECALGTDNCDLNAQCTDTQTGFSCTCNAGWEGSGQVCTDVDECATGAANCDPHAICANTPGGYTCTCNAGWQGNGYTCTDIDECADGTDDCSEHATCTNVAGSFFCSCNMGWTGSGISCTDIDECATAAANCDPNAYCTNTEGSYTCTCNSGWYGNGLFCFANNPCNVNNGGCGDSAVCIYNGGMTTCHCLLPGYIWNGQYCADVDECLVKNGGCGTAQCINTPGSRVCVCGCGTAWNGITCEITNPGFGNSGYGHGCGGCEGHGHC